GAREVPHVTSCSLLTRHHTQAPAVLNHSRALPQGNGCAGPVFACGAIGGERNLIVLDAGDVLDNALAVGCPGIDAEGEVSSKGRGHPIPPSRFTADASGELSCPRRVGKAWATKAIAECTRSEGVEEAESNL